MSVEREWKIQLSPRRGSIGDDSKSSSRRRSIDDDDDDDDEEEEKDDGDDDGGGVTAPATATAKAKAGTGTGTGANSTTIINDNSNIPHETQGKKKVKTEKKKCCDARTHATPRYPADISTLGIRTFFSLLPTHIAT